MKTEKEIETEMKDTVNGADIRRVHNLIILDESGSMESIYMPALSGLNETLQTIRQAQMEHEAQRHFVSLIAFNSGQFNRIYDNTPADHTTDITREQYRPCGGTPLYDAMGRAITELRRNVGREDIVLVTVITDGYENASREYNGHAIKSLVEEMKRQDWIFTYIGANQDVEAVASALSIDNSLSFAADHEGTDAMWEMEKKSRKKFYGRVSCCSRLKDLADDYFNII